jgi:AraC-like DNA-binding protein
MKSTTTGTSSLHASTKAFQKYITQNDVTNAWGINCTTTGFQKVPPNALYPLQQHPRGYIFKKEIGRVLNEYQLIYITRGKGTFVDSTHEPVSVKAGAIIFIVPGEWHSYYPDPSTGWDEYWVGFTGTQMADIMASGFFPQHTSVNNIGINTRLISCFEDVNMIATDERSGFQQYLSGLIQHMVGLIYFVCRNQEFDDSPIAGKIAQARQLMQDNIGRTYSPSDVARELGFGYTWFRRAFKHYVGISPHQYQLQLLHLRAKELLTDFRTSISEISFELGFDNLSQFSTFFRKNEGISPSEYRKQMGAEAYASLEKKEA